MDQINWHEIFGELSGFLLVLGGFVGIVYSGITTLIKTRSDARKVEDDAKMAKDKFIDDTRERDVVLADKLNQIQERVASSLEARFIKMEKDLAASEQRNIQAEEHYQRLLKDNAEKYEILCKRRDKERDMVLLLVQGIQDGFEARRSSSHTETCTACLLQDRALLVKLEEIRVMLTEG
jgi:hypothetical protein